MPFTSRPEAPLAVEWYVNNWNVRGTLATAAPASVYFARLSSARALPMAEPYSTRLLVSASCVAESKLAIARVNRSLVVLGWPYVATPASSVDENTTPEQNPSARKIWVKP